MSDLKNVQPLSDFDWEEFENGSSANVKKQDLEKAYDRTLNKIQEHQVVEGTVIALDKRKLLLTSVIRAMVSFLHLNFVTTQTSK